jgi:hypothetical protein
MRSHSLYMTLLRMPFVGFHSTLFASLEGGVFLDAGEVARYQQLYTTNSIFFELRKQL